ncbi:hypothetical protein C8J56DRAFT_1001469 [Mycena floridula]|nr:hypothetical protein C8J56DRAFT_1001469 [Mycena floridula]
MELPNLAALRIDEPPGSPAPFPSIPKDINDADDHYMQKLKIYAQSLPYSIEPHSKMMELLDFILLRITQCIEAKDFDIGMMQWDSFLTYWSWLKYPAPKEKRIILAKLYFHMSITPGMTGQRLGNCADIFRTLTRSKNKLSIEDMRLPWKPLYEMLKNDLFYSRRQFELSQLPWYMGYMADNARRFFHPAAIEEMLSVFVPQIDSNLLDSILASQYFLLTFLPLSHPQAYLPMLFRMWESLNSYMYDERMLAFLAKLVEAHVSPEVSDPRKIAELPDDERSEGEQRPKWSNDDLGATGVWPGIYKDVGIFTDHEWHLIMCKCLASMEIPLADAGSLTTGPSADAQVGFEIQRLPKPNWRIGSLARIIVYSMAPDSLPSPPSNAPTPFMTPMPSGLNTPQINSNSFGDYLSAPLANKANVKPKSYLAGSKALDSLARMIASTESFFHPSNSGAWTSDLSAFIKFIVFDFNKRWYEEQKPDCKTPMNRRLTKEMRRELVKSLRTVALLAMFSQDSTTVSNIQSCMKSMSVMEPDLILLPVLERAVPSLEALVETQRTIAVIKALGAVAPAIVSRQVYYPGAKNLVPILQLLIPGIDLNDPAKTLCTTGFLTEISQYIKFGDLTIAEESTPVRSDTELAMPPPTPITMPSMEVELPVGEGQDADSSPRLSDENEDMLLKDTTGSFADWVASFIRRVIQLLENLPEEGPNSTAAGGSDVQVVDHVTSACTQICIHLSDSLYDLVLNMVYDYASTNVRTNAVRAIHQLVECVANANPVKTLAKFLPFCARNIRFELENGASSVRSTASSSPLASDATLHWNLAILRGTVFKAEFLSILDVLHTKTLTKRGFSWTGKLLASMLLTLTHTYPLENKFVNPDEWNSEEFRWNHHQYWGKLYESSDVQISWHVPNDEELDFTIQVFRELIEPTIAILEELLNPGKHLSFVRHAFSGIPTLMKENVSDEQIKAALNTSDFLHEIPEMIASIPPINSCFCLTEAEDPRFQYMTALKKRFGSFLHSASVSLLQQGEENTVDAVRALVSSVRTYMLEYGDSKDSYFVNENNYNNEKNVARQYAGQKVWPRAVYVRRARYYHSVRLHWNSMDRIRGPIEDSLIDDLVEWSMWHYASYDGVRTRALPKLLGALAPGTDDDRMKGALWTLNLPSFGRYGILEPSLATNLFDHILRCQHNEKPSVQDLVSVVSENCLNNFPEPCYLVYDIPASGLDQMAAKLKASLSVSPSPEEDNITERCLAQRTKRVREMNSASDSTTKSIIELAKGDSIHWRYAIMAIRCLRTLVRRDMPLQPDLVRFVLERTHDTHPTIYAQRAVMKSLRNIKLRTYCKSPEDLLLRRCPNPLKRTIPVQPSHALTQTILRQFKVPFDFKNGDRKPLFLDKEMECSLAWRNTISLYKPSDQSKSTFLPWETASQDAISVVREQALDTAFWKKLQLYFAEENHETTLTQDNVSCVKSIFQLLEDEPLAALKPVLKELIEDKDQDKQRAAAEFLAGVINGSKHWPTNKQQLLWDWVNPFWKSIFQNLKTDTLTIWTSFIEYLFYNKDPRRLQPLVDYIMEALMSLDFNAELSFDAVKILALFRSFYEELGSKFDAWLDQVLDRCWKEIHSDHDECQPRPSLPTPEVLVKECRLLPLDYDIMGMRGTYHKGRIEELVQNFKVWREERVPGVRAFQSKYDRVAITVCKWLFQSVHDIHAISVFDYILPLMAINDNDELASRASILLVRMCGVTPPRNLVNPILDTIFEAVQSSPSWKVRLKALPLIQVFYFRHVPLISEAKVLEILEALCKCLDDEVVEVRQMAATTLSGVLRLSPRRSVLTFKDRFVRLAKSSHIPKRQDPGYLTAVRRRHAAILGICALVDSYPYTVEKWMPELLTNVLAEHTYDPIPISTTVRKCASNFKKTHQDTWHEDSKRFDEDQLAALSTLLTGSSYCELLRRFYKSE